MRIDSQFLSLLLLVAAYAQPGAMAECGPAEPDVVTIVFQSQYLPIQLGGFFAYPPTSGQDPTESTRTKYLTETWHGTGHYYSHPEGSFTDLTNLVLEGTWSFASDGQNNSSTKYITGHQEGSYGLSGPYLQSAVPYGLADYPPGPEIGIIWGPIADIEYLGRTSRQIIWDGGLNANSGWVSADLHEDLGSPFSLSTAPSIDSVAGLIAGAEVAAAAPVAPDNTPKYPPGALALQYWKDFSPKVMGEVTSRTQPVMFPAQRVSIQLKLPANSCGLQCKVILKFKEWANGTQEPSDPTKILVSSEAITLDKKNTTTWPQDGTFKTYEDLGVPLRHKYSARLVSAEIVTLESCRDLPAGWGTFGLGSVDFSLSLGRIDANHVAGVISLLSPDITSALFKPAALQLTSDPAVTVLRDTTGALRQISASEVFVDIVTLSTKSYAIRSYLPSQAGPPDLVTGLRPISGNPLKSYTFTGDASGTIASFTITPGDVPARAATYTYDVATATMTMAQPGAGRMESIASTTSGTITPVPTEIRTIKDGGGSLVSLEKRVYSTYDFGRVVTSLTRGSGSDAQTTTISYYTASSDTANYGRIQQLTESSGAWTRYTYDTQGRILTETRRYLNNIGAAVSLQRVTTSTYGTLVDQDGDGLAEAFNTRVEATLGKETNRTYEIIFTATEIYNGQPTKRTHSIRAAAPRAAWNASANLVSVTRDVASGIYADKSVGSLSPDGTLTTYVYSTDSSSGEITTIADTGEPNPTLTAVISGTRTLMRTDAFGRLIAQTATDIATSTTLESQVVSSTDTSGRPTRIDYADGTHELRAYACCGLASETDRHGATTTYTYDPLGRIEFITRAGDTTRYVYDAAGNRLNTLREGTDNSEIVLEDNTYDTAGRLISTKDALGRSTVYAYENLSAGGTKTTTTFPSGGTRIETTAADGSLLKIEGTATPWRTYGYGINASGTTTTNEFFPVATITETIAWHLTTTDFLGRVATEISPDGATSTRFYNPLGQLSRQTDPDGVQFLYAYDAQGQLTTTALDLNRDGVIDYAGADRITRSTTTYATRAGVPVSRTTAEIWEIDNSATPRTVSVTDTTLDGCETWQTVLGLTTHTLTTYAANGDATTVTTVPDGTMRTSVTQSGRTASNVIGHPSLGVLSTTTYNYDPHGRLWHQITSSGTTTYAYFDDDKIKTSTTPDPDITRSGPGYDPQTTSYHYDADGRVDRVTQPDGTATYTAYTSAGQVLRTWGSRTYPQAYTYDTQQRVKTLTTWQDYANATGAAVTTWNYHPQRGWLLNKSYTDGTGPTYTYTRAGRLQTRTWARGLVTTYGYDDAGGLSGTIYSDDTPSVVITYDRLGRPLTTTDAAGLLTRSYENGSLDDEVYSGSGLLSGQSLIRTQDNLQRLDSLTASSVPAVVYGYDAASRLNTLTQSGRIATQSYHATHGYPETLSITNAGTPRLIATYALDQLGRTTSVSTTYSSHTSSTSYSYNQANQRTRATSADASYWDYGYDALGQVTSAMKHQADATLRPGHSFGYVFDDIGNRKQTTLNNLTSIYEADLKNQYLSRTAPSAVPVLGTAAPAATVKVRDEIPVNRAGEWFYHELALDGSGAPQYLRFPVSATTLQGTPPTAELVRSEIRQTYIPPSPEVMTHDVDGNLTQDGRWNYTWDAENRLVMMETRPDMVAAAPGLPRQRLIFTYDGSGRRIEKMVQVWNADSALWTPVSELRFLYDGWNLVAEYQISNGTVGLLRSYAWGLDVSGSMQGAGGVGGLLWATVSSATYSPAYDGNGNIVAWIDLANGKKTAEIDYDAFGNPIRIEGGILMPFGFSTKYRDEETGLYYYGLRYYNPNTGRWMNREPLGESESPNLYGMVGNDSVNHYDLNGLYGEAGHFYTTYLVARAAGYSQAAAYKLAYYSQYPDEDSKFDAIGSKRLDVQYYLHSLRGNDPTKLREYLECLLKSGKFTEEEKGLLVHALGDTYAHAYPEIARRPGRSGQPYATGNEVLYSPGLGHALAGHTPDYIGNNPAKYGRYVDQLYSSLSGQAQATEPANPALIAGLKAAANGFHESGWADYFGEPQNGQNAYESNELRNLPGGFGGDPENTYFPERENTPRPGQTLTPYFRNDLIGKIKNGVSGCCPPK